MTNQMYSLKWNNYSASVSESFQILRNDYDLVDVTLSCEGKKIPAHKVLLSACSNYFKDVFKGNPCQHPVIVFQNVTYANLVAVVDFIYKGEVSVEDNQLASFLTTAELLEVQGLTNHQESVDPNKVVIEKTPDHSKNLTDAMRRASSSGPIIVKLPAASKRRRISVSEKEVESRPSKVPENEATNDSISFEEVSVKQETPDFENMVQMEEVFGSDPIGIDIAESSAELTDANLEMIDASQNPGVAQSSSQFGSSSTPRVNWVLTNKSKATNVGPTAGFRCADCNKVFKSSKSYWNHAPLHRGKTTCNLCSKIFADLSGLYKHKQRFHPHLLARGRKH